MSLYIRLAKTTDAAALAELHTAVADDLTAKYGRGPWSSHSTEKGVLLAMSRAKVYLGRVDGCIVGMFELGTRKPWAIDPAYFTPVKRPLYLTSMAVAPSWQRQGLGRKFLEEAVRLAEDWPADAIRLDAYDAPAGGGGFYAKCGWTELGRVTYRAAALIYYEFVLAHT